MINLTKFSADSNHLVVIPEGTFAGIQKLDYIKLSNNRLEFICDRNLANPREHSSLNAINLNYNILISLEPWQFARAQALGAKKTLMVGLKKISLNAKLTFTNTLGLDLNDCSYQGLDAVIDRRINKINRISDILVGWAFKLIKDFACLFSPLNKHQLSLLVNMERFYRDCIEYPFIQFMQNTEVQGFTNEF